MAAKSSKTTICSTVTKYGTFRGRVREVAIKCRPEEDFSVGVQEYLGIPYAKQPVEERRFKPLEPLEPSKEVQDATKFKNAPIQAKSNPLLGSTIVSEGEDCAYLNIWRPIQSQELPSSESPKTSQSSRQTFQNLRSSLMTPLSRRKSNSGFNKENFGFYVDARKMYKSCDSLDIPESGFRPRKNTLTSSDDEDEGDSPEQGLLPVFVFLYGGGFHNGGSSEVMYHGHVLSGNQNVVVVTLDYRLGVLGFLHIPGVVEANLGLKDQLMALKWVRENISAFGGDPDNVTLAGHSSGASSVFCHYLSAESRSYFHKAFVMSGPYDSLWAVGRSRSSLVTHSQRFVTQNGGSLKASPENQLKFLQSLPRMCFSILLDRHFLPFGPIEDGSFFSLNNLQAMNDDFDIPVLATLTKNEGDFFAWFILREKVTDLLTDDTETYSKFVQQYLHGFLGSDSLVEVQNFYSSVSVENPRYEVFHKISDLIGDTVMNLSFLRILNDISFNFPGASIYMGVHDYRPKLKKYPGLPMEIPEFIRCSHGVDLLHVFGHNMAKSDEEELVLMHSMQECIQEFMTFGSPINGDLLWPKFTKDDNVFVYINPYSLKISNNFRTEFSEFWDNF